MTGLVTAGIGAALKIGSSIYGGIQARKAADKQKALLEEQRAKNQNWYDRRYNEDATQRADTQRLLTQTQELLKNRARQSAAAAAVGGGGTAESIAAEKAANNETLANTISNVAANAEATKNNIEATYMQNENAFNAQKQAIEQQKANNIAQAVQMAGGAGDSAFGLAGTMIEDETPKP